MHLFYIIFYIVLGIRMEVFASSGREALLEERGLCSGELSKNTGAPGNFQTNTSITPTHPEATYRIPNYTSFELTLHPEISASTPKTPDAGLVDESESMFPIENSWEKLSFSDIHGG